MEESAAFASEGLTLRGTLHRPAGPGKRPGIVLCHGFGGSSAGADRRAFAEALAGAGYTVLRFDFRGCGASDGEPGRILCLEEVEDLRSAVSYLQSRPEVDTDAIAVIGGSLGGSVAIHAAAIDPRIRACAANGAIGNGERRFRYQYPADEDWRRFLVRLEEAKQHRQRTGRSLMMSRFDIVYIPEALRAGLSPGARMEFPAETAISMLSFNPEEFVARIAPRPLLLTHPRGDDVVPVSESERLAAAAGKPCELHIFDTADHFSSGDRQLHRVTLDWLARHLPTPENRSQP